MSSPHHQYPVVANVTSDDQDTSLFEKSTFVHANTECPICLDPIINRALATSGTALAKNMTVLNCHHVMCTACFVTYIQRNHNCPICRKSMFEMNIDYRQHMYVIPVGTSLGQRLRQQLTPQESNSILRISNTRSLRDAPPLSSTRDPRSSTRAPLSSTRAPLSSTRAPRSSTRASRRASRSPVRYYSRRRELSDYYDEDYDIEMTDQPDTSNIYHGAGRAAGVMLFIIADIAIMAIWLISLWLSK
tara:strand:- start:147 stop:884 length:738 start_codon:yes stop_codon:yes gene_type:complete